MKNTIIKYLVFTSIFSIAFFSKGVTLLAQNIDDEDDIIIVTKNSGVTVTNKVTASANTGGNSAENGGIVTTGDKSVKVEVSNEINGENLGTTEITVDSSDPDQNYNEKKEITCSDNNCNVENEISIILDASDNEQMPIEYQEYNTNEKYSNLQKTVQQNNDSDEVQTITENQTNESPAKTSSQNSGNIDKSSKSSSIFTKIVIFFKNIKTTFKNIFSFLV